MLPLSRRVKTEEWKPIGVEGLERNALKVVRSTDNQSVVAGPGAGKTEILAQRASYLLQTGTSRPPQRILAISFKRDAATNLAERVRERCHRDHAGRFDSLTFDAFAKGIVDRFGQALPERWRPRPDYEIWMPNLNFYRDFLRNLGEPPSTVKRSADETTLSAGTFARVHLAGRPLPVNGWPCPTPGEWAAERLWRSALHEGPKTRLSFPMIGRLAELLLRLNRLALEALRLTYSHLFMDEFQDTTQVQYDLVRSIFLESNVVVTAVGDVKQQIMRWANAIDDPFGLLKADFNAKSTPLSNNYRSSPELVRIQHVLATALDVDATKPVSKTTGAIDGESCAIWDFSSTEGEAAYLANHIVNSMGTDDLAPRDFVLLVRQKAADYAEVLIPEFAKKGLVLRNESGAVGAVPLQDLLSEEVSRLLVRILRVATSVRAGGSWGECLHELSLLRGLDISDTRAQVYLSCELDRFAQCFRCTYASPPSDENEARTVVETVQDFVGHDRLIAAHPAYRQGDWFGKVTEAVAKHLHNSAVNADDWTKTLDDYEGRCSVPLMTIHKSKGLEYHTVIFVGLDDRAWWSFTDDPVEGKAGFFVAFSRAKQRAVFTYCMSRGHRDKIAPLYSLLQSAGVESRNLG